ncbi:MAG TPA: tRNA (adenosine(37)-N6)-dimethylallyltransferase MiaA [Herpetosiphonaceae bacterium]
MNGHALPPLVAIVGPTAVGKTALSIALARRLDGEIVNADSRQIYRCMDIGTAKPSIAEQAAAPHHLIDIVAPDEPYSLAVYQQQALHAVEQIVGRRHVPLLVGGTGQYVAAVLEGWNIPRVPPQPDVRARLEAEAAQQGTAALYARLQTLDPAAAARIEPNNRRRIIRALEVYEITGIPISTQQTRQPPPYRITTLWLTLDRATLYRRIDQRVDAMIAAGLVDEVRALLDRGYDWSLPALSSLGYKELRPWFEGSAPLEECIQRLKFNTHAFVRKQDMWFKRLPHCVHVPADDPALLDRAMEEIREPRTKS